MAGVIDLGQYLRVLLRWSGLIAALTLLGAVAGLLFVLTRTPTYESVSTILVKPAPQNVSIEGQAGTGELDPILSAATLPNVSVRSLAFLSNGLTAVESRVVQQLGNDLPAQLREPGVLREHVAVTEVAGRPDVLEVRAAMADPGLAVRVTNLWTAELSSYFNQLIGRGYFDPETAEPELQKARADWQAAQQRVTQFERESGMAAVAVQVESTGALLSSLAEQRVQVEQNLDNATLLRSTLQGGRGSQASTVPLLLLSIATFTVENTDIDLSRSLPSVAEVRDPQTGEVIVPDRAVETDRTAPANVQPILQNLESMTPQEQSAFLGQLIAALRQKQTRLTRDITALQTEYAESRAQLQDLTFQREQLQVNRSAERSLYESLRVLNRQQEVTSRIQSEKVTVVGEAIEAVPSGGGLFLPPILGGLLGALIGTLAAFLLEFIRNSRSATRTAPLTGARS